MSTFAVVALTVLLLLAFGQTARRRAQTQRLRERLAADFTAAAGGSSTEELTAGDYGLTGLALWKYRYTGLLNTPRGRLAIALASAAMGWAASQASGRSLGSSVGLSVAAALLGVGVGYALLTRRQRRREREIRRALPDALELLAAIMEGGTAFDAALGHVVREGDPRHPLYLELGITLEAMRRGRRRYEALALFAQRVRVVQVDDVVAGLNQADRSGSSITDVLRHHARTQFREYEAEVQRRAERLPIKMMLPMIFTIMPAMFIVTGLPSFLRIYRVLESIIGR